MGPAMLLVLVAVLPLGHSVVWPTHGVYAVPPGSEDYDRIVVLAPAEAVTLRAPRFTATPVFKTQNEADYKDDLYSAVCAGSTVVPPDDTETAIPVFRAYEQFGGYAPWAVTAAGEAGMNYTSCVGQATLSNTGNTRFLLFLGGNNDQRGIADFLAHGANNIWFHAEWNDQAWTFPTFVVASCLVVAASFYADSRSKSGAAQLMVSRERFYLYILAIGGFAAAGIEGITHIVISQKNTEYATGGVGQAVAIVLGPNIAAIALTLITMYGRYDWMQSHYWGVLELGVGFAYMLFWIGLYVGAVAIMAAAVVRLYQGEDPKLVAFTI